MQKISQKISRQHVWTLLLAALLLAALLLWVPLLWGAVLRFDPVLFSNEYYKTLADIAKLLLAFWLANVFLKDSRLRDSLNHYRQELRIGLQSLLAVVTTLSTYPNHPADQTVDYLKATLLTCRTRLDYLASVVATHLSEYRMAPVGSTAHIYTNELRQHIVYLMQALDEGEIISKKPFTPQIEQSISFLLHKLPTILSSI